jgi:hypothetical protein
MGYLIIFLVFLGKLINLCSVLLKIFGTKEECKIASQKDTHKFSTLILLSTNLKKTTIKKNKLTKKFKSLEINIHFEVIFC